ncbi:hypothetical protein BD289DRAFT_160245 [Coniella lustricola]|uniref:Uncharacterized protein n=1 Tax=Coniella lustricola TaxID=2025994 RepID=A0A2T2ZUI3_9PEZI|nr:hypothetical protein BD289DRAFT_160245 [Coniella lustricola]
MRCHVGILQITQTLLENNLNNNAESQVEPPSADPNPRPGLEARPTPGRSPLCLCSTAAMLASKMQSTFALPLYTVTLDPRRPHNTLHPLYDWKSSARDRYLHLLCTQIPRKPTVQTPEATPVHVHALGFPADGLAWPDLTTLKKATGIDQVLQSLCGSVEALLR